MSESSVGTYPIVRTLDEAGDSTKVEFSYVGYFLYIGIEIVDPRPRILQPIYTRAVLI